MSFHKEPFPPLVDIRSASWPLSGLEANTEIAAQVNRLVSELALQYLGLDDHIYGLPFVPADKHGK